METKNTQNHENRRLGLIESLHMQHCSCEAAYDEVILMRTHNIHFHNKIGKKKQALKYPLIFDFLSCRKNFLGTQKRVRISNGKRVIGIRVIEVLL